VLNVSRFVWSMLILSLALASCEDHSQEVINQQYLKSKDYTSFEQKANREKERNVHRRKSLEANLKLLPQCKEVNDFSIPFEIKGEDFPKLLRNHGCDVLSTDSVGAPLKLLGKTHFRDADTYFVLIDNEILSTNRQLLAVTFDGGQLLSFKAVGAYKKSISRNITTNIKLVYDGEILKLTSKMIRDINYPIKQHYTITTQYEIDGKGNIREI